jgi:hypothetical protein
MFDGNVHDVALCTPRMLHDESVPDVLKDCENATLRI